MQRQLNGSFAKFSCYTLKTCCVKAIHAVNAVLWQPGGYYTCGRPCVPIYFVNHFFLPRTTRTKQWLSNSMSHLFQYRHQPTYSLGEGPSEHSCLGCWLLDKTKCYSPCYNIMLFFTASNISSLDWTSSIWLVVLANQNCYKSAQTVLPQEGRLIHETTTYHPYLINVHCLKYPFIWTAN